MDLSFPFIHTWSECLNQHWQIHSKILFQHSELTQNEKFLWRWLATTFESANEFNIRCSHSIEQLSIALNKPCEVILRLLLKLKLMGFLRGPLPLPYEKLTYIMVIEVRKLVLCMPSKIFLTNQEAYSVLNNGVKLTSAPAYV